MTGLCRKLYTWRLRRRILRDLRRMPKNLYSETDLGQDRMRRWFDE